MRPASVSAGAASPETRGLLTRVESTFRNPKLGAAALVVYKSAADAGAKAALFAITVLAARRLPPRSFGVFALGTTIGWLLSVASDFGVQMHLARAVARAPQDAAALLGRWGRVRVGLAGAGVATLGASLIALHVNAAPATAIFLLALAYSAAGLVEFLNHFYRGLSRTDIESTLTMSQRAATLVLGVAALLWWPDVNTLAVAMLIPPLGALAWSIRRATSLGADARGTRDPAVPDDSGPPRAQFVADVAPIGLGVLLSALYFRIDLLLVEWWVGTEAVARYNAVFRLVDALRLFPAAVLAVMLPALCRAEDFRPLARVAAAVTGFGIGCATFVWLTADRIVGLLYGPAYETTAPTLRVLALSFPLMSLNYALTYHLIAWNRQRAFAGVCAAALAANLALNAWLIPAWSIDGAAWATLATEIVLTGGCLVVLYPRS